jgi:cation diffusion facilitator CzcD-associated flavoprotein CzcO
MSTRPLRVAVVGAGIGGLTAAIALQTSADRQESACLTSMSVD